MSARVQAGGAKLAAAALALLLGGCAGLAPSERAAEAPAERAAEAPAEQRILLTVEQKEFSAVSLTGSPDTRYLRRRGYGKAPPDVDRVLDQLSAEHGIERREGWPIRSLEVYCEVFAVPDGGDVGALIERLREDPRVDLAQPMNRFETLASRYDDPYADLQPAALELGLEQAHRLATGKGVLIAVIDSAVDAEHPDLLGRVSLARDLVGAGGRARAEIHGTAVAGVIASAINNTEGIVGVAPDVRIASLRACRAEPSSPQRASCSSFSLAQALDIAIAVRPGLINLSIAGPADPLLGRLLDAAAAEGIVLVAAEPGTAHDTAFPASHPAAIVARGATGAAVDAGGPHRVPAPADEILTTTPGAGYAFLSGTSLAAAHVTGVIALLLERDPSIAAADIVELLDAATVRNGDGASVHACRALERLLGAGGCSPDAETAAVQGRRGYRPEPAAAGR